MLQDNDKAELDDKHSSASTCAVSLFICTLHRLVQMM